MATVTVKCVGCGARKEIPLTAEAPLCDKDFMPMIVVKASAGPHRKL
jgi:hypothetical protein